MEMLALQCSFLAYNVFGAFDKTNPSFTSCCANGKIKLPAAPSTPQFLNELLNPNNGLSSIKLIIILIPNQDHISYGVTSVDDDESLRFAQLYISDIENEIVSLTSLLFTECYKSYHKSK
ncbi:hypothetical protein SADUNF_Sadunf04G0094400 [Salix dunnii]|uniref:Uncharacterized protein n=1 Tax=Salix dunnii TaxID=1413687 RepID=A0A835K4S3_9ROSI|nr:hypothetical protein SADUNF_Sadunf04G0094400 [Salix dunnii]